MGSGKPADEAFAATHTVVVKNENSEAEIVDIRVILDGVPSAVEGCTANGAGAGGAVHSLLNAHLPPDGGFITRFDVTFACPVDQHLSARNSCFGPTLTWSRPRP